MLQEVVYRFLENASGKSRAEVLSERTNISARSWQKIFRGETVKKLDQVELVPVILARLQEQMSRAGYSESECMTFIDNHALTPWAGLVYETAPPASDLYPKTKKFAAEIDAFEDRLLKLHEQNSLEQAKELIINSCWLEPRYFTDKSDTNLTGDTGQWDLVNNAKDWIDLENPLAIAGFNTLFSLLSLWDVEFCLRHFQSFRRQSVFVMLMPYIKGEPDKHGRIEKKRDMFHLPVRRLIDFTNYIAYGYREKKYPETPPSIKWMVVKSDITAVELTNWRRGKGSFTFNDYLRLLREYFCKDQTNSGCTVPPMMPLYVAAIMFNEIFVKLNRSKNYAVEEVMLYEELYLYWWESHMQRIEQTKGITFGDTPWPEWLVKP